MSESTTATQPDPPPSLLRRCRWLVVTVTVIGLAPSLLTVSGKHRALLGFLQPQLVDALDYESLTTHWWSPLEISNLSLADLTVENTDATSEVPLVSMRSLRSVQPLWKLILWRGHGAEFVIHEPVLNLSVHDGRTNVEDTLERLFGTDSSGGSSPVAVVIEDGTIRLSADHGDSIDTSHHLITGIHGRISTLNPQSLLPEVTLVAETSATSGGLAVGERRQIAATLDELSADFPLQPFSSEQIAESGSPSARPGLKIQTVMTDTEGVQQLMVEARQLDLSELRPLVQRFFPGADCQGKVSGQIQAQIIGGTITTGLAGRVQLIGDDIRWRQTSWAESESLNLERIQANGALALAEDGVVVNDLNISSTVFDLSGGGEVRLRASDPAAAIIDPRSNQSPAERKAVAEAQAMTAGQVNVSGRVDVAAIARMLPRTLNIGDGVEPQTAVLEFSARIQQDIRQPQETLLAATSGENFRWQLAAASSPIEAVRNGKPIRINSPCRLDASGHMDLNGATVETAVVQGSFGEVAAHPAESGFAISGSVNPERLWMEFRELIDIPRPGLKGNVQIVANIIPTADGVSLSDVSLKSSELEVSSRLLKIYPSRSALHICEGQIDVQGNTAALRTVIAPWHTATWLAEDSTLAARLVADPARQISIQAIVRRNSDSRQATSKVSDTGGSWLVIDEGRLDASVMADQTTGDFLIEKGTVEIVGLKANLTGTMGVRHGLLHVNLAADTEYDLDLLSQVIDPAGQMRLTGQGHDVFHVQGAPAIWSDADRNRHLRLSNDPTGNDDEAVETLHATGRIVWANGRFYGTAVGPGQLVAELKDGIVRCEPISCAAGSGELNVMPQWNVDTNVLQFAAGSRIENLDLTPELCREWIGYVAPMFADAASIDGKVSARVHQFSYLIDAPAQSTIQAILTVHHGSATPGSSLAPLLQVFSTLGKSGSESQRLQIPAQEIPFELRNGMILHNGLEMSVVGYSITSSGGVGLDRSIDLMLDVPMSKSGSTELGRSVRIPVRGSVDRPRIDTAGLLQNLGRQQVEERVGDQLDRGLNKLFDKLR